LLQLASSQGYNYGKPKRIPTSMKPFKQRLAPVRLNAIPLAATQRTAPISSTAVLITAKLIEKTGAVID
jgi:hypothetical protein